MTDNIKEIDNPQYVSGLGEGGSNPSLSAKQQLSP